MIGNFLACKRCDELLILNDSDDTPDKHGWKMIEKKIESKDLNLEIRLPQPITIIEWYCPHCQYPVIKGISPSQPYPFLQ